MVVNEDITKLVAELNNKYDYINIHKIEQTDVGFSIYMDEPKKELAWLEHGSVVYRTPLDRGYLDLVKTSPAVADPKELYRRSIQYYYENGLYGAVIDTLVNLSAKGFENDIDDIEIKYFFDSWNIQCSFNKTIQWILQDFFRVGLVRTYKVLGKYDPPISYLPPIEEISEQAEDKELGQRKRRWSKSFVPVRYTVLNPLSVEIEGSLLFDLYRVTLQPSGDLKQLFKKKTSELTQEEKILLKGLPSDWKKAVDSGKNIVLDSELVGGIDYRRQPYERYPRPRGARAFDSLEYKAKLKEADLSTLDGITNYILKITIGNDEFPVTSGEQLQQISQLFNTPAKSFNIVWNHTLQIEKIVSPEISSILGQDKYIQVNEDLTAAFGIVRALVDGVGSISTGAAQLAVKTVIEEVNYARFELTEWIYREYRQVAESAGFKRHPKVRWDDMVLKDEVMMTSLIQGMIDRRIISYQTGHEKLGLEHNTELKQLQREKPFVLRGDLGIFGSPFQKGNQVLIEELPKEEEPENNPNGNPNNNPNPGVDPNQVQKTPKGTPSEGRPRGNPGTRKRKAPPQDRTKVRRPQRGGLSLGQFKFNKGD